MGSTVWTLAEVRCKPKKPTNMPIAQVGVFLNTSVAASRLVKITRPYSMAVWTTHEETGCWFHPLLLVIARMMMQRRRNSIRSPIGLLLSMRTTYPSSGKHGNLTIHPTPIRALGLPLKRMCMYISDRRGKRFSCKDPSISIIPYFG